MSTTRIAIVGAGLAGLACATALVQAGQRVSLFDKARGPGGRMSTRRIQTVQGMVAFDHGAQYFTARDPAFQDQLQQWAAVGLVAPWPAAGEGAWVGVPTMNSPLKHLADAVEARWCARVDALSRYGTRWRLVGDPLDDETYDHVLVALPAEQAAALLAPVDAEMAMRAVHTPSAPCWTVMVAFPCALPIIEDTLRDPMVVGWAARNSAKPGRAGPESWVLQATPDWSLAHLEDQPTKVLDALLRAFSERAGITLPPPLVATTHRWRYARSGAEGTGALWNPRLGVGACGDWLLGPRVECAWLSGTRLAAAVLA